LAIGNTYSIFREIENGVVQGAVLSMIFFLVAMAKICRGIEGPIRMLGDAD
jgi:MFS superfamily sulfate permease-like transporter